MIALNWRAIIIALKKSPFFKHLSQDDLNRIKEIYKKATLLQIEETIKKINRATYDYYNELEDKNKKANLATEKLNNFLYENNIK